MLGEAQTKWGGSRRGSTRLFPAAAKGREDKKLGQAG